MFLKKDDFFAWLDEYTRTKRNDLQRSQTAIPKRSEKIVLNLSVAPRQPVEINFPFKSVTFTKATDATSVMFLYGEVKLILDSNSIGNIKNAVTLKLNDTFNQDQTISKCFITWDAQPSVFAELTFLEDSQLYSPPSKVYTYQGTTPWTVVIRDRVKIAEGPIETEPFDIPPGGSSSWTVPDNEYWHLNLSCHVPAGGLAGNLIKLNSTVIAWPQEKGFYAWEWDSVRTGDTIDILADLAGTGIQGFFAKYEEPI